MSFDLFVCVSRTSVSADCPGSDGRGSGSTEGGAGDSKAAIRSGTHTHPHTNAHIFTQTLTKYYDCTSAQEPGVYPNLALGWLYPQ